MTYEKYQLVAIPFPFSDSLRSKKRPAIIVSSHNLFNHHVNHSIVAMVTYAEHKPWPLDVRISNLNSAHLTKPSVIRMKFFTIDHRLIIKPLGKLSKKDQKTFLKSLKAVFTK